MFKIPGHGWLSGFKNLQQIYSPDNTYQPDDGMNYWREQIFMRVIIVVVIAAALVVGLTAILSIQMKYWTILVMDLLAFSAAFFAAFSRRLKLRVRIHLIMIIIFCLGLFLQIIGGPIGNGNIILFVFPVMAAILLGLRDATIALGMNIVTMIILGIMLHFGVLEDTGMAHYTLIDWIGTSTGLIFFDALITFSLAILLEGLTDSFDRVKKTQTALQKSQERYQAIIEDQIELIDRWKPDGTLTFVNQAVSDYTGIPREELLGKNFFSFLPEKDQAYLKEQLKTLTPSNPVVTLEEAVTIKGRTSWMRWTNRALFNENGEIQEFQSVGTDITERKHVEETLERSESRYRAIVETQHEIISRWRPDTTMTFINEAGCRFYNKSQEELLQTSIIDQSPQHEKQKLRDYIASFTVKNPSQTIQLSGTDKDGNIHWFEWRDNALIEKGRIVEFQSVGRDITTEKQIQDELLKSEARYRAVVEDQVELIGRALPDGKINFFNHAFARFYGLKQKEIFDGGVEDLIGPEEAHDLIEKFQQLSPENPIYSNTFLDTNANGENRWYRWTNHGIFDTQGNLTEVQVIGQDVHERKLAEQALQESEARYRAVVEDQLELICRLQPDGTINFTNHTYARFFGTTPEKLIASNVMDLVDQEEAENLLEMFSLLSLQKPIALNTHLETNADGQKRWYRWTNRGIFDTEGNLQEIQAIGQDIHEQKLAEQALQASEARYRVVVEDQLELICRTLPNGTYTFANNAYARFYGRSPEELLGKNTDEMLAADIITNIYDDHKKLSPDHPIIQRINETTNAEGVTRWFTWTDRGLFDEEGNLIEIQGIGRDIHEQILAEQALQESEARYRAVVEDQTEMICRLWPNGIFTFVNDAYARFHGKQPEDMVGHNLADVVKPNRAQTIKLDYKKLTPDNPIIQRNIKNTNLQGETRWFQWIDRGIFDEEGNLIEIQGIGRDIHEQMLAEHALQESEARYRAVVEDQVEMICRLLPDGTFTFANNAYARFYGKLPEELVGRKAKEIIRPEMGEKLREKYSKFTIDEPLIQTIDSDTNAKGENRWLSWTDRGIFDAQGNLVEIQALGQDIHERKLAEQALQASEARYRAIVEGQIEPVCRWRPDYTLTFVNDAYCKLFNKTREELLGQSIKLVVPEDDWVIIEQMVLDLKTGSSNAVDENRIITAEGIRWLQWALSAIKAEDGTFIEFQSVGHDVSEQKHTQQMLEKTLSDQIELSKANSELAERLEGLYLTDVDRHEAQLGHLANELHDDVLNALAVVSTNLDPDETPGHVIHAYEQAIQRTREIVNGLRTAMINYGLYIGLETLADELSDQLPEGPFIYVDVPHSVIRYESNVELHLFRIVQEACNNAIKHANASEIHIQGKLDTEKAILEIADNGRGFDAEDIIDLPDLLHRKHFGLAGMFERAELIHGELGIHSEPHKGCRVCVVWHAKQA
jgi:PAS domain S-box-containing protein